MSSIDAARDLSTASPNPYRDLVEKYEALLEVRNMSFNRQGQSINQTAEAAANQVNAAAQPATKPDADNECIVKEVTVATGAKRKINLRTPTDFSEAETSSSGFSDEISNKGTQTDETFLCTIGDGVDKFSIYDEASPIDSRFRHCPKYRDLFKEIFATLKKAAENKDEGEKLPLLDDSHGGFTVPPVTPAVEELPAFPIDDTASVVSSVVSEQSVAMSECVTKHERKTVLVAQAKKNVVAGQENKPPLVGGIVKGANDDNRTLIPFKREPLEYLPFGAANLRKKHKRRGRQNYDPSDSPVLPSTPRITYVSAIGNRQRRRDRSGSRTQTPTGQNPTATNVWNGNSMTIYNRNAQSPVPHPTGSKHRDRHHGRAAGDAQSSDQPVFRRPTSTAAHDLQKLIKLDLSYAEVLRRADERKTYRYQKH